MAIYEYDCEKCGTFEVTQKMSEPALTTHEVCGAPVQRRISRTSFALKGGGWYSDGYASSGGKKAESASTGGGCGSGACGTGSCAA